MKLSTDFLKATKDKSLSSFLVIRRKGDNENKPFIRLCLERNVYGTNQTDFIEHETELRIDTYSSSDKNAVENSKICFHLDKYAYNRCALSTFLSTIKKDSEVSFLVRVNNGNDNYKKVGFVCHQLFGLIDKKTFFLSEYVGPNNMASPIE